MTGPFRSRILLVDDHSSFATSYGRALEDHGFDVSKVSDSRDALQRLKSTSFDVVLAELITSDMNGLEFLKKVHAFSPNLSLILLVAKHSNEIAVEAAELGALPLVRPISGELLSRTIQRAVSLKRARSVTPDPSVRWAAALEPVKITATKAKNQMGQMLKTVMQGGVVLITVHETPEAAVISMAEYEKLTGAVEARLNTMSRAFDDLLTRMQTPEARAGMRTAFAASPEELAKNAIAFARKRGCL
jgi:prevent-host-death family protein